MKRARLLGIGVALVTALFAAFVASKFVPQTKEVVKKDWDTLKVLVADKNIDIGQKILSKQLPLLPMARKSYQVHLIVQLLFGMWRQALSKAASLGIGMKSAVLLSTQQAKLPSRPVVQNEMLPEPVFVARSSSGT